MSAFPGNRIEGIVKRQIGGAQERGAFHHLPGNVAGMIREAPMCAALEADWSSVTMTRDELLGRLQWQAGQTVLAPERRVPGSWIDASSAVAGTPLPGPDGGQLAAVHQLRNSGFQALGGGCAGG